ncbi:hypothetical protein H0176_00765 [Methylorubrum populi]|uniref:Secreted peptide n=1 Tax=Methylorubrum rhodesianum TaxID=29427 RepID=A0ABU9Z4I1_9HYPH|nr:hypothetical protein [Methylorubrum rhodesianum]MBK3402638.1 hypothetical protein [Methylorubrum rhodesianum]MBY0138813.1 hypothetical protein [Methylorubrum populi]
MPTVVAVAAVVTEAMAVTVPSSVPTVAAVSAIAAVAAISSEAAVMTVTLCLGRRRRSYEAGGYGKDETERGSGYCDA